MPCSGLASYELACIPSRGHCRMLFPMRKVELSYEFGDRRHDGWVRNALVDLLHAVQEEGSIAAAAKVLGFSYRHVWGELRRWEAQLGHPLVLWEKGQRAKLAPFGEKLLWAERQAQARLAPQIEALHAELERAFAVAFDDAALVLNLFASHDDGLSLLRGFAVQQAQLHLDIRFLGSVDAIAALNAGRCTLAGFHSSQQPGLGSLTQHTYQPLLQPGRHKLIGFAERSQGLMVAPGNPLRLASMGDVVRWRARFVNRPAGSGTRLLCDELLARDGIPATDVTGYTREEPSHAAVAQALDHDEMVVAVLVDERDGGDAGRRELLERGFEAVRLEPVGLEVALHVEQRETLVLDLVLVTRLVHGLEDGLLAHRVTVVVGQERGKRGGTAAEIELLTFRREETPFLHADRGHGEDPVDFDGTSPRGPSPQGRQEATGQHESCGLHVVHLLHLHVDDRGVLDEHVVATVLDHGGQPRGTCERAFADDVAARHDVRGRVLGHDTAELHVVQHFGPAPLAGERRPVEGLEPQRVGLRCDGHRLDHRRRRRRHRDLVVGRRRSTPGHRCEQCRTEHECAIKVKHVASCRFARRGQDAAPRGTSVHQGAAFPLTCRHPGWLARSRFAA